MNILQSYVVTSALHDSGELSNAPKCHPNTRVSILQSLFDWSSASSTISSDEESADSNPPAPIQWLHGPAGSGKSAIMRSLAEMLASAPSPLLLASFFFFRSDPLRNHPQSLVATLAYQVAVSLPAVRPYIEKAVLKNPLVFKSSLKTQMNQLILNPLTQALEADEITPGEGPRVILIDGVDECVDEDKQTELIELIAHVLENSPIPVSFLIASRPDRVISEAFPEEPTKVEGEDNEEAEMDEASCLFPHSIQLILDKTYFTNMDIRTYFVDSFKRIREKHPLRAHLVKRHVANHAKQAAQWPSPAVIDILVKKASGQFIYAVTVIRFVEARRFNPAERLDIILGYSPPGRLKPFEQLDTLYSTIFLSIEEDDDRRDTLQLLGTLLAQPKFHCYEDAMPCRQFPGEEDDVFAPLAELLTGFPLEVMRRLLLEVESLVSVDDQAVRVTVYHTSLADFLFDQSRAGDFYVNPGQVYAGLAERCVRNCFTDEARILAFIAENLSTFLQKATITPSLREALCSFDFKLFNQCRPVILRNRVFRIVPEILEGLKQSHQSGAKTLHDEFQQSILKALVAPRLSPYLPPSPYAPHLLPLLLCCSYQTRPASSMPTTLFSRKPLVVYACTRTFFGLTREMKHIEQQEGLAVVGLLRAGSLGSYGPATPAGATKAQIDDAKWDITISPAFEPELEECVAEVLGEEGLKRAAVFGALRILEWVEKTPSKLNQTINYPTIHSLSATLGTVAAQSLCAFLELCLFYRASQPELTLKLEQRGDLFDAEWVGKLSDVKTLGDEAEKAQFKVEDVIRKYLKLAQSYIAKDVPELEKVASEWTLVETPLQGDERRIIT